MSPWAAVRVEADGGRVIGGAPSQAVWVGPVPYSLVLECTAGQDSSASGRRLAMALPPGVRLSGWERPAEATRMAST